MYIYTCFFYGIKLNCIIIQCAWILHHPDFFNFNWPYIYTYTSLKFYRNSLSSIRQQVFFFVFVQYAIIFSSIQIAIVTQFRNLCLTLANRCILRVRSYWGNQAPIVITYATNSLLLSRPDIHASRSTNTVVSSNRPKTHANLHKIYTQNTSGATNRQNRASHVCVNFTA